MMRVEPLKARSTYTPVETTTPSTSIVHVRTPSVEHARDGRRFDRLRSRDGPHREPLQPTDSASAPSGLRKALEQRIVLGIREMAKAWTAHDQQPDQQAHPRDGAVVATPRRPGKRSAGGRIESSRQYWPNNSSPTYEVSALSVNSSWRPH
jgi:hypothetical protein